MKIEMDDNSTVAVQCLFGCIVAIVLLFATYRYNVTAYELGYTQKQLECTTQTMWVKPE